MTKPANRLQTNIILFLLIVVVGLTIALIFTLRELKTRPLPEEVLPPKPAPPVAGKIALIIDRLWVPQRCHFRRLFSSENPHNL